MTRLLRAGDRGWLLELDGPGIAHGRTLQNLDSVDVQPLLGRLLGITVPHGDGALSDSGKALQ